MVLERSFVFFSCFLLRSVSRLSRDQNEVLAEDREKLRVLQPLQPWFTQEQREELAEVHSWIQQNTIPEEINTQVHTPARTHIYRLTHLSQGWGITSCPVLQGCDSCRIAGAARPPLPSAPDSSSSRELPEQEPLGPDVET